MSIFGYQKAGSEKYDLQSKRSCVSTYSHRLHYTMRTSLERCLNSKPFQALRVISLWLADREQITKDNATLVSPDISTVVTWSWAFSRRKTEQNGWWKKSVHNVFQMPRTPTDPYQLSVDISGVVDINNRFGLLNRKKALYI